MRSVLSLAAKPAAKAQPPSQTALVEMTARGKRRRLIEELAKVDRKQERVLAEASFCGDTYWPEY